MTRGSGPTSGDHDAELKCIPELLAIENEHLVVRASTVQEAMSLANQVLKICKRDELVQLNIYHIPSKLVPLALAVVRGKGEKEEFEQLGEGHRKDLLSRAKGIEGSGLYHTSEFFNSFNLYSCQ